MYCCRQNRRLWLSRISCFLGVLVFTLASVWLPVNAQTQTSSGNEIDGFPVMLEERILFRVKQGIPNVVSAEERAKIINQRLAEIVSTPDFSAESLQIEHQANLSVIKVGEKTLFTVREEDAIASKQSRIALGDQIQQDLKEKVIQYQEERSFNRLFIGSLIAIVSTIALFIFLNWVRRIGAILLRRIQVAREADRLDLRTRNLQILGSYSTSYLLSTLVRLAQLVAVLSAFHFYIPFVLGQFPATKPFSDRIIDDIIAGSNSIIKSIVSYLPNLFIIILIIIFTYYIIGFARLLIIELGRDDDYSWFYPEWVRPTIRLATLLIIAVACVAAAPYLPGFGAPAFQGVSLFLGALFTLGSSSAIANAVSGVILIYTRAFRIGDFIKIGDITGYVTEKSIFVTRLTTPKNEVITIPNASVSGANVTNYSAILREDNGSLILYTTVTIGYDVTWKKAHEALLEAANKTPYILPKPAPFILQTALNDFNVAYELNVYTDRPDLIPRIYSDLHQNIQDACNQAGIELLSPTYSALRDGNHVTIPAEYLSSDYVSPSFQINSTNNF